MRKASVAFFGCALMLGSCNLKLAPSLDPFYTAVLTGFPQHEAASYGQGRHLLAQGRFKEAIPYFERSVKINAGFGEAWLSLGQCQLELNNFKAAESAFRKANEVLPNKEVRVGLIRALAFQGKFAEADTLIDTLGDDRVLQLQLQGDAAFIKGDTKAATDLYGQSLRISPNQPHLQSRNAALQELLTP